MHASKKWPGGEADAGFTSAGATLRVRHRDATVRLALAPAGPLPAALLRLTPAARPDGGNVHVHVAAPLLPALDLTVAVPAIGRALGALLGVPERWTGFIVDRLPGDDLSVRWSLFMPPGSARAWQAGEWRPLDALLGAVEVSNVLTLSGNAEFVLDEGAYPVRVALRERRWTRARWPGFWARDFYAFVFATKRPVPVPNGSLDAWTVEAHTIAEALYGVGAQVLSLRHRTP